MMAKTSLRLDPIRVCVLSTMTKYAFKANVEIMWLILVIKLARV